MMRLASCLMLLFLTCSMALPVHAAATHNPALISAPPPEPRDEIIPGERDGYLWTAGYWGWNGAKHVWHPGHWISKRSGFVWAPTIWEQRGDKWELVTGHWEADPDNADAATADEDSAAADDVAEKPTTAKAHKKQAARKKIDYHNADEWPHYIKH